MSGLKSAWELSMEKSDKMIPGLKKKKKLTDAEKKEISAIRKDYQARIADRDVMLDHQLQKLAERTLRKTWKPPRNNSSGSSPRKRNAWRRKWKTRSRRFTSPARNGPPAPPFPLRLTRNTTAS